MIRRDRDRQVLDMTRGRPSTLLLGFSLPLVLGNLFQQLYTFVDTLIVGQKLGVKALAALGATEWMCFLMFGFIQGLTQGLSIPVAKYFGQVMIEPALMLLRTPAELSGMSMLSSLVQVFMRIVCAVMVTRFFGYAGIFWGEIMAWLGADLFLTVVLIWQYRRMKV